jgi:hypothetical protein
MIIQFDDILNKVILKNMKKKIDDISYEEWEKIGEVTVCALVAMYKLQSKIIKSIKTKSIQNKALKIEKPMEQLRSFLDDEVCRIFTDKEDREVFAIFYGPENTERINKACNF